MRLICVYLCGDVLLALQDYFEEELSDAEVLASLCREGFMISLVAINSRQEQARDLFDSR